MPRALITGISGQDGAYLAKLLIDKGYEVYGAERRSASGEHWRLQALGIFDKVKMVSFELLEQSNVVNALEKVKPDEIYNLAAMSFVGASFDQPVYTCDVNGLGVVRLLEAAKQVCPKAKIYQASTSEMFGSSYSENGGQKWQDENTPFHPRSPYGCAKLLAHSMCANYRESYNTFVCSGILFNHESPLRGNEFVTKKITRELARISIQMAYYNKPEPLELGNMNARRDWGHAEDYVHGMWLMLQQKQPGDYVLSTGETRSVRDFVNAAAKALGWKELRWEGEGLDEKAYSGDTLVVRVNPKFYRPADVEYLCGRPDLAVSKLGWERKYSFEDLVASMVRWDLDPDAWREV